VRLSGGGTLGEIATNEKEGEKGELSGKELFLLVEKSKPKQSAKFYWGGGSLEVFLLPEGILSPALPGVGHEKVI